MNPKVAYITTRPPGEQEKILAAAPQGFTVDVIDPRIPEDELVAKALPYDFLLLQAAPPVPPRLIREAPRLKLVQLTSQGFDRVPVKLAAERGIPVANNGGANATACAEHAVMLMLAVYRRLPGMMDLARNEREHFIEERARLANYCRVLAGKRVGIIGLGNQGRRVARIVTAFEAEAVFYNHRPVPDEVIKSLQVQPLDFEELLMTSDIVTLHVPLNEETAGMIGARQLEIMKPSAILVNVSRGRVVDEEALVRALSQGRIAGAGLDVFVKEPPKVDNPLLHMVNVVATPHMAGADSEEFDSRVRATWENISRVWSGLAPRNVVNGL